MKGRKAEPTDEEVLRLAIENLARDIYPHGHPGFIPAIVELVKLHSDKNYGYAHGGNPLGNFYRVAQILQLYPKLNPAEPAVVCIIYLMKHLDAILWQLSAGHEMPDRDERLQDITVYSTLARILLKEVE